ncbi:MAG: F0F1 ATP synthase subunit A [Puniceicoccales bacterium]|nr:F0F1 ATP synthase subunit A [Puniceicoccales bacterium]
MRILLLPAVSLVPLPLFAAGSPAPGNLPTGVPLTNTVLTGWVVTILFIVVLRLTIGHIREVPGRAQAAAEGLVVALRELFAPIVGKRAMPLAFPVLVTLFIFILIQNWAGLLPGMGTIGWGTGTNFFNTHVATPIARPPTSDLNGTVALALVSFGAWLILVLKYAGPRAILRDWFGNKVGKGEVPRPVYWMLSLIFLGVGIIELGSVFIRPLTLSVRLFGNVFGGETLLHKTFFALPFCFLELFVGLVQALVFTLLSAVYIGLLCNHEEEPGEGHAH